jgi:hypothetical protein
MLGPLLFMALAQLAPQKIPPPLDGPPPPDQWWLSDPLVFSIVQGWITEIDPMHRNSCSIEKSYADASVLRLGLDRVAGGGVLTVRHPAWRSLEEGKHYRLQLHFDFERGWVGDATAVAARDGEMSLAMGFDQIEFLNQFMTKQRLAIRFEGRRIADLTLAGSHRATKDLLRCQAAATPEDADPFARPRSKASDLVEI